ncbi:MAG: hypothetical protein AAE987_06360 [Thermoplasmataceae archaeon]|jgi:hypothetical protein
MGKTRTIIIDEAIEKGFNEKARLKYGYRKGSLVKAMNEVLEEWLKSDSNVSLKENLRLPKSGVEMKKWKFNREDLHER